VADTFLAPGSDLNNNNGANGYVEVVDGLPNTSGVSQAPRNPELKKH
jgi:hypothetical protein